jgi:hypothetical protein
MKLRHATPARNVRSILRRGLLTAKSKCRMPVIWLHAAGRSPWATLHTMRRHHCNNVTIIEVSIPRTWLTRSKAGLWFCNRNIPPVLLGQTLTVEENAA